VSQTPLTLSEAALVHALRLELSQGPVRLFRNNVGLAVDSVGHHVRYGLCPGSSDLIGWRTRVIHPVDVGCEWAVFCALEAKHGRGRLSPEQQAFIDAVRRSGGLAGEVRTIEQARAILGVDRL
jgi:hypothetical protein